MWELLMTMQKPFYDLFEIFYHNSEDELFDARTMAYDDDWKCYTSNQLKIMEKMGLIEIG